MLLLLHHCMHSEVSKTLVEVINLKNRGLKFFAFSARVVQ